jgi:hypothetical protein
MTRTRGAGRPTLLTEARSDELVRLIRAGSTFSAAAEAIGVSERAIRGWRRRAWSADPRDASFVRLERALVAAIATRREPARLGFDWQAAAQALAEQHPERLNGERRTSVVRFCMRADS